MDKKEIEIVPGDGNLDISPVEDHINDMVKKQKPIKKDIIIPKTKEEKK